VLHYFSFDFNPHRHVPLISEIFNKRRPCFSIAEKVKIIECLENSVSNKDFCQELRISQSTLSTIWKSKDQINNKKDNNYDI